MPHPIPSKQIFQLTEKLIISKNDTQQYRNSIQSILKSLTNRNVDIIRIVYDDSENRNWGENSRIFTLNTRNYGYFQIPVEIRWEQDGQSYQYG
ncbi:hypothetical protein [Spiroplasma ixodetis]|uniref:Uncharacterized protein n=1 Tax=Spiroplasma ixodetis TaxID=2141 RepID=A0ABM8JQN0_9MOLU